MSSRISVKISTAKMISALEKKVKELTASLAKEKSDLVTFEDKHEEWSIAVAELAHASGKIPVVASYSYDRKISLTYHGLGKIPAEPRTPVSCRPYNEITPEKKIEEIENTIRILKMTDEETVSTSTFKAISQYL